MAGLKPGALARSRDAVIGTVVGVEVGVVIVATGGGDVRASFGAPMLAALARDRGCAPSCGDRVLLRRWPDGRLTVERRLRTPKLAPVIPLHQR